jgi:uncharacterized Zn finger protein
MREAASAKGRRYLTEARLDVESVRDGLVVATCRGDAGDVYPLGRDWDGRDWCSCPAKGRCAHLVALGLVVRRRRA